MEAAMKTISIRVTPVDNQPPTIVVGKMSISCDEGGFTQLTTEHISAEDADTKLEKLSELEKLRLKIYLSSKS